MGGGSTRLRHEAIHRCHGFGRQLIRTQTVSQIYGGSEPISLLGSHFKLTEAAGIQDVRGARARRQKTLELFREYRDAVDSIIMLRAFRHRGEMLPWKYQLVEIPTAMFCSLESAPVADFAPDGPTIDCSYRDEPVAARVSLDRSDAKITVEQIKLSVCILHAEWHVI